MISLEEHGDTLESLGCTPVGISVDSRPCKKAWADSLSISRTRLLSDFWPHGAIAQKFGIFREENGFSERANIIIDAGKNVIFVKIYPIHSVPDIQEIIDFLKEKNNSG
jgi:peroxiredoxin